MAPAKNQLSWKTAKNFQQCEPRNDSENQHNNSSHHQDFSDDFPCEYSSHVLALQSCHEAQKCSSPHLSLSRGIHPLLAPTMRFEIRGNYSFQFLISVSFKRWPSWKSTSFLMNSAVLILLLTQAPVFNCSFVGCNCNWDPPEINEL